MDDEIRSRLRRLGVVKGTRNLKSAPKPVPRERKPAPPPKIEDEWSDPELDARQPLDSLLPGGYLEETAVGECFVLDQVYPLTYRHGPDRLQDLTRLNSDVAAVFCQDSRLRGLDFKEFVFLDTETTGLAGAGILAFMVGVAFFDQGSAGDALVVRQYFLRDHGDEPAMLQLLEELLAGKVGIITFNGRSFDLPLLDNRYLMNRMPGSLLEMPHIDLLPPSRRLWRHRLGSCALGALEQNLLGVRRTQEDVPGWLIPGLYHDYLRTGDAREIVRVFYHNEIDMLSMVTLANRILRLLEQAREDVHPIDLFSLAKWQADLGMTAESERSLRTAAAADLPLEFYHQALGRLGQLLKRDGRREEAVPVWQQIAATSFDDVAAHVELAMHYEWQKEEIDTAIQWTEQAIALVNSWNSPGRASLVRDDLLHRLSRLQRKIQNESSSDVSS